MGQFLYELHDPIHLDIDVLFRQFLDLFCLLFKKLITAISLIINGDFLS
jgi:hypothetical protein